MKSVDMESSGTSPWFIGAHAENSELFERLLSEFIRDHMQWRRDSHPDDFSAVATPPAHSSDHDAFVARMRKELLSLSGSLKSSVPLFSPRYMGHMLCDPLMPGLLAQMLTLPYNPNNVSEEVAPVTIGLEVEVGLQLARMIGYNDEPERTPCAFGYLTAGGTLANYQALHVLRAVKYYPLALQTGMHRMGLTPPVNSLLHEVAEVDAKRLINLSVPESVGLHEAWCQFLNEEKSTARRKTLAEAVKETRLETLGAHAFFSLHRGCCSTPLVLVPETAHYSWTKAARLLGIGESALVRIPMCGMRLDPGALEHALATALRNGQSVLCVVGVLGTTEYGTLDPIHEIVAARERWHERGLGFAVHADAAWGGYLATLFRDEHGFTLPRESIARHFKYFPSEQTYAAFRDLGRTDSATVDPHKLGYLPYGVGGAYVCRDHRCMDFIAQGAPYLGSAKPKESNESVYHAKFRHLSRYTLEGSKPGAAAAATYVTHRVMPLDAKHFGKLLRHSVQSTEYFYDRINAMRNRMKDCVHISIPIQPDSNLVCIAFNPVGNEAAAAANAFTASVLDYLRVDRTKALQKRAFFGSATILYKRMLCAQEAKRILAELNIASHTFTESPEDSARDADGLLILRHTLMNPGLRDDTNQVDYVEKYCRYLEQLLRDAVSRIPACSPRSGLPANTAIRPPILDRALPLTE